MISNLECKFKGIREIPAGSFISDKGEKINYKDSYRIVFDQIINGFPRETSLKITKEQALNIGQNFKLYEDMVIIFNIIIYNSNSIVCQLKEVRKK